MSLSTTLLRPDHRWRKAAYLGSLWASVEIVLGSFLHNIKFPLTGTILSAIGISLLIAGHSLWKERGIVWRAGTICAVMKSVSPSAVIIGPMIGIALEALIVEVIIRLFAGHPTGYFIGSALACTIPLIQKAITYLFTYGTDIAVVIEQLIEFASKSLQYRSLSPINVMLTLISANLLLGFLAAWSGIVIGRRAKTIRTDREDAFHPVRPASSPSVRQTYSLLLLFVHLFVVAAGLITQSVYFLLFIPLWYLHYPLVKERFARWIFWVEIGAVSVFAGTFLGAAVLHDYTSGALLGAQMFFRALFIVTAFSAVSTELRNPGIIRFMQKNRLKDFSLALESAFNALPLMIDKIQLERAFFKHPLDSLSRVLGYTDALMKEREKERSIIIVTGEKGSGKSTMLNLLADRLKNEGFSIGGIIQPGIWKENKRYGFEILDLTSGRSMPLCSTDGPESGITAGPFRFFPEAVQFGTSALTAYGLLEKDVIILDEIGPLEINGMGWHDSLKSLSAQYNGVLIISLRPTLLEIVCSRYSLHADRIFDVKNDDISALTEHILSRRTGTITQF